MFFIETVIRILSDESIYFENRWNLLDLGVLILAVVSIPITYIPAIINGNGMVAVKMLRVVKILRLIKYAQIFKHIFNTLVLSIPLMANIGSLLLLIQYIYTIAGVQMFG